MIAKVIIALLIPVVLGLSAFIVWDRWPSDSEGCPPGFVDRVGLGCSALPTATTPSCSAEKTKTLYMACLRNGGEACSEYAKCAK